MPEMFRTITDRSPLDEQDRPQSISAFQAFTLSAASRVGVGNIAGVGTAIVVGGPGAIFWMSLMAFIGGATSLVESSLAQLFKVRTDDRAFRGGPAYYIQRGRLAPGSSDILGAADPLLPVRGVKRGMFSNEAGMGSVPNASATAAVTHPVKQGLVQTLGVYFDTWLVCSITAFIILVSAPDLSIAQRGVYLTQNALASALGDWTGILLAVIIFLLAFTSVLGNYYYGESNLQFITQAPFALPTLRVLVLAAVFLGSIAGADLIWNIADGIMGLMALINLVAITLLSPIAMRLIKDYTRQRRAGRDPVFTRDLLPDVQGIECWEDELSVTGSIGIITADVRAQKHRDHLHATPPAP